MIRNRSIVSTLAVYTLMAVCSYSSFAGDFEEGKAAVEVGDFTQALMLYRRAANKGDERAENALGSMYAQGQGVPRSFTEAMQWFRSSARKGFANAQFNVGLIYENGQGVQQDYQEAFRWYFLAANQGFAEAQLAVGHAYVRGMGVSQNDEEAIRWMLLSAEQGHVNAQLSLASLYAAQGNFEKAMKWFRVPAEQGNRHGQLFLGRSLLLAERYADALRWLTLAAEQNDDLAQFYLGEMSYRSYPGALETPNYTKAAAWYRLSAEQGQSDAQFRLGTLLGSGTGVTKDLLESRKWMMLAADQGPSWGSHFWSKSRARFWVGLTFYLVPDELVNVEEAEKWFRLSAMDGDADAQYFLGFFYLHGLGVAQNDDEALRWFRPSAEQGNPESQVNLGYLHQQGRGVSLDYQKALKWYRLSADQNNSSAQNYLGVAYANGEGISQDFDKAIEWFRLSAEQDHPRAQYNLGVAYRTGQGVLQNAARAAEWFRASADQGYANAQLELGTAYGLGEGVTQSHEKARKWYLRAAEQGFIQAQYELALLYLYTGKHPDFQSASHWLNAAAEQGAPAAQLILGQVHLSADDDYEKALKRFAADGSEHSDTLLRLAKVIDRDQEQGARWIALAAKQGDAEAQYLFGLIHMNGIGVVQNYIESSKWIRAAVEQGHPNAIDVLPVSLVLEAGFETLKKSENACDIYRELKEQLSVAVGHFLLAECESVSEIEKRRFLEIAAERGVSKASFELGQIHEADGASELRPHPFDLRNAEKFYNKALVNRRLQDGNRLDMFSGDFQIDEKVAKTALKRVKKAIKAVNREARRAENKARADEIRALERERVQRRRQIIGNLAESFFSVLGDAIIAAGTVYLAAEIIEAAGGNSAEFDSGSSRTSGGTRSRPSRNYSSNRCTCSCVNGTVQPLCPGAIYVHTVCAPRYCPVVTYRPRRPAVPLHVPGTNYCRQEQVYDPRTRRYQWKKICR